MNTDVEVAGADRDLQPWFQRVEAVLSRFDAESALSQLNGQQEQWVVVPPLLYRTVRAALEAARITDGAFDPTVLDALEAAGYGRSFELGPSPAHEPGTQLAGAWREIRLDPKLGAVWLPGVRIDLGGIGKGLAVDGAMAGLQKARRVLINAGGDLAVRTAPGDPPMLVDVADPFDPDRNLTTFALAHGSAATSSTLGRRWGRGLHHIIDPRTGRPADSGVVAATVVAAATARAEVLAKACIVLGAKAGLRLLGEEGCHGLLVTEQREVLVTPGMEVCLNAEA